MSNVYKNASGLTRREAIALGFCALIAVPVLGGCSNKDAFSNGGSSSNSQTGSAGKTLTVGSQDFYENEIIAEAYAQALEAKNYTVNRSMRIGQREVYMPELESGSVDVFPEYTGNLLQYYDADTAATQAEEVYNELNAALPEGLRALDQADAADADSYVVTKRFADEHGVASIADLAGIDGLALAGNSELQTRPYGPDGLKSFYNVKIAEFKPVEDSGGPLTVKALRDGDADIIDLYSSSPELAKGDLVVLEDPKGMFLASHVVPIVSKSVDDDAAAVINAVQAALTSGKLIEMNDESVNQQRAAADIAHDFLQDAGLL